MSVAEYFLPENAKTDCREERLSPSGRYKLALTPFGTKPGSWNHVQGLVYAIGQDEPIAEVQRNYSAFPFLFIEDHPSGHPLLVCGADYQGQTVIELDTGERRDFLPEDAEQGHGFCWAEYTFHAPTQLLVVNGCYWACPYEFRFFDFSEPMKGWPELHLDVMIDDDGKPPEFESDGTIKCYQTREADDSEERVIAATTTLRREGSTLIVVEEWVSEEEQKRRADNEAFRLRYEEERRVFRATDPLYLAYLELVKDPALSPADFEGTGITYEKWCPDFKEEEARWTRRIIVSQQGYSVDLEWAAKTGPIKVVVYKEGKRHEDRFFGHSVQAMHEAFTYAKGFLA